MHFDTVVPQTIDTSPSPCVQDIDIMFEEEELAEAEFYRFERFFHVWITNTKEYAPKLTNLRIVLRPSWRNGQIHLEGIQAFLAYFNNIQYLVKIPLTIWLDKYAKRSRSEIVAIAELPTRII
jgi:hypothetical protein